MISTACVLSSLGGGCNRQSFFSVIRSTSFDVNTTTAVAAATDYGATCRRWTFVNEHTKSNTSIDDKGGCHTWGQQQPTSYLASRASFQWWDANAVVGACNNLPPKNFKIEGLEAGPDLNLRVGSQDSSCGANGGHDASGRVTCWACIPEASTVAPPAQMSPMDSLPLSKSPVTPLKTWRFLFNGNARGWYGCCPMWVLCSFRKPKVVMEYTTMTQVGKPL